MKASSYGILTIDPGVQGTGIAVWDSMDWAHNIAERKKMGTYKETSIAEYRNPTHAINLYPKDGDNWEITSEKFRDTLSKIVDTHGIHRAYCEFPEYFQSALGHGATAKGDIYKLAFIVGVFAGVIWEKGGIFDPVYVTQWKGQVSKDAVIKRIQRVLPTLARDVNPSSHSYDAIGIGLWRQGIINQ